MKKQTAEEFVMDFKIDYTVPFIIAKQCALIAIDKMFKQGTINHFGYGKGVLTGYSDYILKELENLKQEIERL